MNNSVEMISTCTCFNCDVDSPLASTSEEALLLAANDGWVIGLDTNQEIVEDDDTAGAVYACTVYAVFLADTVPVLVSTP